MPVFYNYTENGVVYSFDDVFVPADAFRRGNLWGWGRNDFGQLGINNTSSPRCTPVTTSAGGATWKQITSTAYTIGAIKTDGTLWTWGRNAYGGVGDNTTTDRLTPVTTFAGGTNWKQVSGGWRHMSAIKTDGTLWIWGNNAYGQLGTNEATGSTGGGTLTPITTFVGGTNWKQVSNGVGFTAAIKTDGTLWTWGYNNFGQLGDNTAINRSTPVTTFAGGTNWKQVAGGVNHTAAIKTDGTLWTWGYNNFGQLGDNTAINRSTPVTTFAGGTNWKQVAGWNPAQAIKTDGTLWTWGYNDGGQLGTNDLITRLTPVTTFAGGTNWKRCGEKGYTTSVSAIKTDGTLWIWGSNATYGAVGTNDMVDRLTPVTTFLGGTNWNQVVHGYYHVMATTYIDDYQ